MRKRSTVIGVATAVVGITVAVALFAPAPKPLEVRVLPWTTTTLGGMICAVVAITNVSSRHYWYSIDSEVFVNGGFESAFYQSRAARQNWPLAPQFGATVVVPLPPEGGRWRIKLRCQRVPGRIQNMFTALLYQLGIERSPAAGVDVLKDMQPIAER